MKEQPPARRSKADFELKWFFAGVAGLLFLAAYLPKHPMKESKTMFKELLARRLFKRKQGQAAKSASL